MKVEIVSPEGKLLDSEADLVSLPGVSGAFEILNNHAPIISLLGEGYIRLQGKNIEIDEEAEDKFERTKDEIRLKINSGTIEMNNNRLVILVE
jgi:F-type H+-transporting ATPase subunit epsilon